MKLNVELKQDKKIRDNMAAIFSYLADFVSKNEDTVPFQWFNNEMISPQNSEYCAFMEFDVVYSPAVYEKFKKEIERILQLFGKEEELILVQEELEIFSKEIRHLTDVNEISEADLLNVDKNLSHIKSIIDKTVDYFTHSHIIYPEIFDSYRITDVGYHDLEEIVTRDLSTFRKRGYSIQPYLRSIKDSEEKIKNIGVSYDEDEILEKKRLKEKIYYDWISIQLKIDDCACFSEMHIVETGLMSFIIKKDIKEKYGRNLKELDDYQLFFFNEFYSFPVSDIDLDFSASKEWHADDKVPRAADYVRLTNNYYLSSQYYQDLEQELIVNGNLLLAYQVGRKGKYKLSESRSFDAHFNEPWSPFEDADEFYDKSDFNFSGTLFEFFFNKLRNIDENFNALLDKFKKELINQDRIEQNIDAILYLQKYYQSILNNPAKKLVVFDGMKTPKFIADLFTECLIELLEIKKLKYSEGTIEKHLALEEQKPVADRYPKKSHLKWNADPQLLKAIFMLLHKNNKGKVMLDENTIDSFLHSNFDCFPNTYPHVYLESEFKKNVIMNFFQQFHDQFKSELNDIAKLDIARLIRDNFKVWKKISDEQLENTIRKNLSQPVSKAKKITINKQALLENFKLKVY